MNPNRWHEHKDRPAWVRRHRDELEAATGLDIPQNLAELDLWLNRYKAVMTRKIESRGDE